MKNPERNVRGFRGNRKVHTGRRNNREGLKRLPSNYCWRLLRALLDCVSDQLSSCSKDCFHSVFRRQDVAAYYELDASFGLQSISEQARPMPGNPAVSYMLASLLRKCSDMSLIAPKERKAACLRNVVNLDNSLSLRNGMDSHPVYQYAKVWLRETLGPAPSEEAIQYSSRHGPGSSASIRYGERSKFFKLWRLPYRSGLACRNQLLAAVMADTRWCSAIEDFLRRRDGTPMWAVIDRSTYGNVVVDGGHPYNVITVVPKDGRKDRPIAKEQTGNIYLQLGLGHILRSRLRTRGIDLDKQADVNRSMALSASRDNKSFTMDLSNASDTIGYDLVKFLLPDEWFRVLDSLRAPWGVLPDGSAFLYRKFSSMGNGFTFELETLIFLSICKGIQRTYGDRRDRFVVFGDDIIGPDYLYLHCRNYLSYAGFMVNSEKSFHGSCAVRESCGVDALSGLNIRPVYIKSVPRTVTEAISLRNRLRSWFLRHLGDYPATLDRLLIGDTFRDMPPIGPDSPETDGWLQDGPRNVGWRFDSLVQCVRRVKTPKEFHLRKLMHDLRSCDGEGGNFLVTDENSDRYKVVGRVVDTSFDWLDY